MKVKLSALNLMVKAKFTLQYFVIGFLTVQSNTSTAENHNLNLLVDNIKSWTAAQLGTAKHQVSIPTLDARTRVSKCERLLFDFPFSNRSTARARCTNPPWQLFFRVSVKSNSKFVVAKKDIEKGAIVAEGDLEFRNLLGNIQGRLVQKTDVVGKETLKHIKAGDGILKSHLANTVDVMRVRSTIFKGDIFTEDNLEKVKVRAGSLNQDVLKGKFPLNQSRANQTLLPGKFLMKGDVISNKLVVVVSKNISPGTILDANVLKLEKLDKNQLAPDQITRLEGLSFRESLRSMRAGEPLRMSDTREAVLIRKGDSVVFTIGRPGGLSVSASVTALEFGKAGQQIRLRNNESGRIVRGVVVGKSAVNGI